MSDRVFYCPDCRQQFPDSPLPGRGELFDCPRCHLLFIPADKDFAGGVGPREHETEWADEGVGRRNPKPPYSQPTRHRRRKFKPHDLIIAWVTGGALLVIACVLFAIVRTGKEPRLISPPIASDNSAPVADARGSPTPPVPDSVSAPKPSPPESRPRLDEATLVGEWEAGEQPLEGIAVGDAFAFTFNPRGAVTLQSRFVLSVVTFTGQWRLAGSTLTLRLNINGEVHDVSANAELRDADTLRLTVGGKAAEFKRKK